MTYVLGDAAAAGAPLRLTFTCAGDGWESLARAYLGSATLADAQKIIRMQPEMQGKTINNANIQAFIKSRAGWSPVDGLLPFVASNNPGTKDANGKPEGYAHFNANTQLMLPDMPRLDGKQPKGGPAPVVSDVSEAGMGAGVIFLGIATLGLLVWGSRKKKKSSPKPVAF